MEISKTFTFEASHVLPHHKGKCANLHGHSWVLTVAVSGPVDPHSGFVMDYAGLKGAIQPIVDDMDHAHLGVWSTSKVCIDFGEMLEGETGTKYVPWLKEINPTSENLLISIARQIKIPWSWISLNETCTTSCKLTREEYAQLNQG